MVSMASLFYAGVDCFFWLLLIFIMLRLKILLFQGPVVGNLVHGSPLGEKYWASI